VGQTRIHEEGEKGPDDPAAVWYLFVDVFVSMRVYFGPLRADLNVVWPGRRGPTDL
jgi:hypothetical protein